VEGVAQLAVATMILRPAEVAAAVQQGTLLMERLLVQVEHQDKAMLVVTQVIKELISKVLEVAVLEQWVLLPQHRPITLAG
tara:strand:+ start:288 stop:530 length:243 start_codon:yes stop_codon:yes gene_type:complete